MMLASFAMVVTPEHTAVDGVFLTIIFNRNLFQSQESRERLSNTQVATDDHATMHTNKYINMA